MRAKVVVMALAVGLLAAACSGSSEPAEPTATPRAEATPTATSLTSPTADFAKTIVREIYEWEDITGRVWALLGEAELASPSWKSSVREAIDAAIAKTVELRDMKAPPEYAERIDSTRAAWDKWIEALTTLRAGIQAEDGEVLGEALSLMSEASRLSALSD